MGSFVKNAFYGRVPCNCDTILCAACLDKHKAPRPLLHCDTTETSKVHMAQGSSRGLMFNPSGDPRIDTGGHFILRFSHSLPPTLTHIPFVFVAAAYVYVASAEMLMPPIR